MQDGAPGGGTGGRERARVAGGGGLPRMVDRGPRGDEVCAVSVEHLVERGRRPVEARGDASRLAEDEGGLRVDERMLYVGRGLPRRLLGAGGRRREHEARSDGREERNRAHRY